MLQQDHMATKTVRIPHRYLAEYRSTHPKLIARVVAAHVVWSISSDTTWTRFSREWARYLSACRLAGLYHLQYFFFSQWLQVFCPLYLRGPGRCLNCCSLIELNRLLASIRSLLICTCIFIYLHALATMQTSTASHLNRFAFPRAKQIFSWQSLLPMRHVHPSR